MSLRMKTRFNWTLRVSHIEFLGQVGSHSLRPHVPFISGPLLKHRIIELIDLAHILPVRILLIDHIEGKPHGAFVKGHGSYQSSEGAAGFLRKLIHVFHEVGVELGVHSSPLTYTGPIGWSLVHCKVKAFAMDGLCLTQFQD